MTLPYSDWSLEVARLLADPKILPPAGDVDADDHAGWPSRWMRGLAPGQAVAEAAAEAATGRLFE